MPDAIPKRRWFQFHLSTAIMLMFVAAGFMFANVRAVAKVERKKMEALGTPMPPGGYGTFNPYHPVHTEIIESSEQGWPFACRRSSSCREANESSEPQISAVLPVQYIWDPTAVVLNAISGFSIFVAVAFLSEYVFRRREAKQS
jgi:hypothetical protein